MNANSDSPTPSLPRPVPVRGSPRCIVCGRRNPIPGFTCSDRCARERLGGDE